MHKHEADKNMSEAIILGDAPCVFLFLGLPNREIKIKTNDFHLEMRFAKWEYKITIYFDKHSTYFDTLPSK